MDRVTKEAQVSELKDKLGRVASIVLADYRGLDVPTVTGLRDEFRKVQCEYKVFKNTLVKLAIKGTKLEGMSQVPRGPDGDDPLVRDPIGAGQGGHQVRQGPGKVRPQGRLLRGRCSTPRASRASRRCRARTSCGRSCSRPSWHRRRTSCARYQCGRAKLHVPPVGQGTGRRDD